MSFRREIEKQFGNPHGMLGLLAGWIMANRPSNRRRNLWTLDLMRLDATDHALEIGFGPGFAVAAASTRTPHGKIYGIDRSPLMLAQASKRNRAAIREGRVELHLGDAGDLSWLSGPLDKIWSVNAIQFWASPEHTVQALYGALKPGGTLATSYQPRHRGATPADSWAMAGRIESVLNATGFADVRTEKLPLNPPVICTLGVKPADRQAT